MKKKSLLYWYIFLICFLEIIYRLFVWKELFCTQTIITLIFSIPFAFICYFLSKFGNKVFNIIISINLSITLTFLFMAQFIYYAFYKTIFSLFSLFKGTGQVFGEFFEAILDYIIRYWYVLLIMLIPFIMFIIFIRFFDFNRLKKKEFFKSFLSFMVIYFFSFLILFFDKGIYSIKNLYFNVHSPMLTISKVGVLTMEKLDVKRYILGFEDKLLYKINDFDYEEKDYNILDIDFGSSKIDKAFKESDPSEKNEYTGMFKNKNLVFITAESLDASAIREDITPTLYKLLNNSFVFNNFYQPLFPVSTSDGEYMSLNSLLPKEGTWSFYDSSDIYMPYGLGNVFNKLGYKAFGYHNHSYDYYERQLSHSNIGFNYIGCGNGLEKKINCNLWAESDLEMIESTINDYINEEKFIAYYMTVSGHLMYNQKNDMVKKNYDKVEHLNYSEDVKGYLAATIELDKAIEVLIKRLEENGKLDDTLIVIVPDHYPYGLSIDELNEISDYDRSDKFELYHTSLIMYNPNIPKTIIDDYVSGIDILPTVYNLFGIDFDSRLLMGRDILSDSEKIVILSDRSWITNKGKYDSIKDKFYPFEESPKNYVEEINKKVYQKFALSSLIIQKDYYRSLDI